MKEDLLTQETITGENNSTKNILHLRQEITELHSQYDVKVEISIQQAKSVSFLLSTTANIPPNQREDLSLALCGPRTAVLPAC